MKREKFKRSYHKNIFSTHFFLLIFIAIIVFSSSAYAIFNEKLTISGTVTGQAVYTYYFERPSDWGDTITAHVWTKGGSAGTSWTDRLPMSYIENSSKGNPIYSVKITATDPKTSAFYTSHDQIIFTDGSNQTVDILIDKTKHNNKLYTLSASYAEANPTKKRLAVKWGAWSSVYAYIWYNNNGTDYYFDGTNFQATNNWPGIEITNNKLSNDVFYIEYDKTVLPSGTKIIFNNGNRW